jgi:DNA repair protein RecO (recombination protein O)
MATRVESQPAYILHSRNFRDTSLIIECLTADHGRVSAVLKGVRANSKSAKQRRSSTQPFTALLVSWSGKTELKTITAIETRGMPIPLQGMQLFSALYVNELLSRLLLPAEPHSDVFTLYQWTLNNLLSDPLTDVVLRRFELQLLEYLGYGIDFKLDFSNAEPISSGQVYSYHPERGFTLATGAQSNAVYRGEDLLAIAEGDFNPLARRSAKRLCREALRVQLGSKPLNSRQLFR